MDEAAQDKLVGEANAVGIAVKKITDQLREVEAANATLTDALHRDDEEIARKDAIIADLTIKLDDVMADSDANHAALVSIGGTVRETMARRRQPPAQLTGAPNRPLPNEQPMPRIVSRGPVPG